MKIIICDRCGMEKKKLNRIHVYDNTNVNTRHGKQNRPKRKDYDLCNNCKKEFEKFMEFGD